MTQRILLIGTTLLLLLLALPTALQQSSSAPVNGTAVTVASTLARPPTRDGRIVGGLETSIRRFPHQVSLQLEQRHVCGATILAARIVLSAAHCVIEHAATPQLYGVRAGSTEYESGGTWTPVRNIIAHAQFNTPSAMSNDIAVLSLTRALNFGRDIQPLPLATPLDMRNNVADGGVMFYVSGWGTLSSDSKLRASRLRYTTLRQIDQQRCATAYAHALPITSGMLCAGTTDGAHDSCQGDSGGPLVAQVGAGRLKLVGIVSFGIGCGDPKYPGIYTKVAAYNVWIKRAIAKL